MLLGLRPPSPHHHDQSAIMRIRNQGATITLVPDPHDRVPETPSALLLHYTPPHHGFFFVMAALYITAAYRSSTPLVHRIRRVLLRCACGLPHDTPPELARPVHHRTARTLRTQRPRTRAVRWRGCAVALCFLSLFSSILDMWRFEPRLIAGGRVPRRATLLKVAQATHLTRPNVRFGFSLRPRGLLASMTRDTILIGLADPPRACVSLITHLQPVAVVLTCPS